VYFLHLKLEKYVVLRFYRRYWYFNFEMQFTVSRICKVAFVKKLGFKGTIIPDILCFWLLLLNFRFVLIRSTVVFC
jgi:hypothetical protein